MSEVDFATLRQCLEVARAAGARELELECGNTIFRAVLEPLPPAPRSRSPKKIATAIPEPAKVVAPCVGYFHAAKGTPAPGETVSLGQVVGTVTALGLSNDVEAPATGKVLAWDVAEGEPVQYGQVLGLVEVLS